MGETVRETTCPACGNTFVPPQRESFFCPGCGTRMTVHAAAFASESSAKTASAAQAEKDQPSEAAQAEKDQPPLAAQTLQSTQDQAAWAVEEAARAAQKAVEAARLAEEAGTRMESMETAQLAAAQAAEALRAAQAVQRAEEIRLKEQQEALARQKAEFERQTREREEQERAWREEQERLAREREEQAAREAAAREAEERAKREAAAREAEERAKREAAARAAATQQREQPKQVGYRRDATIRHTDGRGLFIVTIPSDWAIKDTAIMRQSTRPFNPQAKLEGPDGSIILRQGDAGTRLSSGMKAIMGTYGAAIAGVDRTNYADMPHPVRLADAYVSNLVRDAGSFDLRLVRDIPSQDLAKLQQDAMEKYRRTGRAMGNTMLKDPFAAEVLRVYGLRHKGVDMNVAVYVRLYATKDATGVENLNPMGLMFNAGSALGGLFSGGRKAQGRASQSQQPAGQSSSTWSVPDYDSYVRNGTIYWDVCGFATLTAASRCFEECLNTAFLPLVRTFDIHPDMVNLVLADARLEAAQVQQATNQQINAMNMQTQATLDRARQMSAASSAQTEAWLRNSDAHHQAFRERTNAQFNTGGGHSAPDYSEAIRGVNTYVTSDGREVELDVSAERAYENQAGDVIGGSGGFDPGADWTEIPRA